MNRDDALNLLAVSTAHDPAQLQEAFARQAAQLQQRIAGAPTEALKEKYGRQLAELDDARRTLLGAHGAPGALSQTKVADLPLAQPVYGSSASRSAPSAGQWLQPGHLLAGRYEIHEQIGAGGMGAVYRAYDKNREKDIAIKVLLPHLLASPAARERFLREARLASEMSHPDIVTVFDVQQDGAHCFLTMELLRGRTLRVALSTLRQQRQLMDAGEALRIADQIGRGLAYAHERTVHRDVKPENIWLADDGRAKLMDFGIARLLADAQAGATSASTGTAYYMAPEQLAGAEVDARADQYALAATLYEMLAGQVPTGRIESLRQVRRGVPPAVSIAVDRALAVRPEERFASVEEFRAALYRSPGFSLRSLPAWARAMSAAALIASLGFFAWTAVSAMLPDRAAEERAKQEAISLQAQARSLFRQLDNLRREVKDAAASATREAERLESQVRSARGEDERLRNEIALLAARGKADIAVRVERATFSRLDSPEGMIALEGLLASAESLLKDQNAEQARAQFRIAIAGIQTLRATPGETQERIRDEQRRLLAQLDGRWGLGACEAPSLWTVKDEHLHVFWPGAGMFEAAITGIGKDAATAAVIAPASHKGRHYRYTPSGTRLKVEEIGKSAREELLRCG